MTTITATEVSTCSPTARPTTTDRVLLAMAMKLEVVARARMQRRANAAGSALARHRADERRRDAAAIVHIGLLPR